MQLLKAAFEIRPQGQTHLAGLRRLLVILPVTIVF